MSIQAHECGLGCPFEQASLITWKWKKRPQLNQLLGSEPRLKHDHRFIGFLQGRIFHTLYASRSSTPVLKLPLKILLTDILILPPSTPLRQLYLTSDIRNQILTSSRPNIVLCDEVPAGCVTSCCREVDTEIFAAAHS